MSIFEDQKPIFTSLSPNTEKDDIDLAWKMIRRIILREILRETDTKPERGQSVGKSSRQMELEEEFKKYLGVKYAFSFNSGRAALMAILEAMGIKSGDEILLQGFTCNAAVNPILEKDAKPIFVDVDDTINMDFEDLKKKITPHSKAVMIQHSFGWPAQIDKISEIVKRAKLLMIEDCAHSLGAKYQSSYCGTFGDAAFFSLGRDKIISSVFGGIAVTNNDKIAERIKKFQEELGYPSNFWIFQQLLHPILTNYLVLPAYGLGSNFGRIIIGLFHLFSILSKGVYKKEKEGKIPDYFPGKFPDALIILALNQFKKLERFNEHRREIANFYENELKNTKFILPLAKPKKNLTPTFMRYPILTEMDTDRILEQARKRKIYLDDGWRKTPIVPPDTNISKMRYIWGNCSRAEKIAKQIINLPTHINISKTAASKITNFLKEIIE